MNQRKRLLAKLTVVAIAAAATLIGFAAPAQAVYERTCTYQFLLTFSPGLLLATPRLVEITNAGGNLTPCLDSAGVVTGLTANVDPLAGAPRGGNASCTVQTLHLPIVLKWNNGNTSVLDLQSVAGAAGTMAFNGPVVSGELAGLNANLVLNSNNAFLLACASPGGATTFSGIGQFTFNSL